MNVISLPTKEGKTANAIKISARTGATLVVRSEQAADEAQDYASKLGLTIPQPITYFDAMHQRFVEQDADAFIVDDADDFLAYVLGGRIEAITRTVSDDANR